MLLFYLCTLTFVMLNCLIAFFLCFLFSAFFFFLFFLFGGIWVIQKAKFHEGSSFLAIRISIKCDFDQSVYHYRARVNQWKRLTEERSNKGLRLRSLNALCCLFSFSFLFSFLFYIFLYITFSFIYTNQETVSVLETTQANKTFRTWKQMLY